MAPRGRGLEWGGVALRVHGYVMSLHVDSSAASQYIDCGSAAAIDDWTACSIVAWCRATSLATLDDIRRIGAKTSTIPLGKELQHAYHSSGIAQDCLRFRVNRATAVGDGGSGPHNRG